MRTSEHICPFGIKSKDLLERHGFHVEDHLLETREQADRFRAEQNVKTTPQTFIDGERVGGYDDLRKHLGEATASKGATSYQPVAAVFAVTLLLAVGVGWRLSGQLLWPSVLQLFGAFSMAVLGILKLRDLEAFSNQFLGYDLLAQRWVRYAYIYPFVETLAGVAMAARVGLAVAAPAALLIGLVGASSVFKAVYLDKRELKCACVGGNSKVPLGFVSLTENLGMMAMAIAALTRLLG
jgi:glutaredoxin